MKRPSWGCRSFPDGPEVKNPPSNAGDTGSIIQDSGQLAKPAYHNQELAQPKFNK